MDYTQDYKVMMGIPVDKRREFFAKAYTLKLGQLHATGKCAWPIEKLPTLVASVMTGIADRQVPSGPAFDASMKFFNIKTQKALFAFLEY